jgi:hypothetical protein
LDLQILCFFFFYYSCSLLERITCWALAFSVTGLGSSSLRLGTRDCLLFFYFPGVADAVHEYRAWTLRDLGS